MSSPCRMGLPGVMPLLPGLPTSGWLAISEQFYRNQTRIGLAPDPCQPTSWYSPGEIPSEPYAWLKKYQPVAKLGALRVYYIPASEGAQGQIDYVEVVNEPLHDPPAQNDVGGGHYLDALGGTGRSGGDWVIEAYTLAREVFPDSQLTINEYGVIANRKEARRYAELIELLKSRGLLDVVGIQAHAFTTASATTMQIRECLDIIAGAGLPVAITLGCRCLEPKGRRRFGISD